MTTSAERDSDNEPVEEGDSYLCSEILAGCQRLLEEVDTLQEFLSNNKQYRPIELLSFQSKVKAEIEFIQKDAPRTNLALVSWNIP